MIKILFIGESWLGSCARSLREALARRKDLLVDDLGEDQFIPKPRGRFLRAAQRLLQSAYRDELYNQIRARIAQFKPQVVMTYKGYSIHSDMVFELQRRGIFVVNVYPDNSPHAHGAAHREAVGCYDLVISTKPYHPPLWHSQYGYSNDCVFVPQGYDPFLHHVPEAPDFFAYDIVMAATWRQEYGELMLKLSRCLAGTRVKVCIAGAGWEAYRDHLPKDWELLGPMHGVAYVDFLRSGRICIAPLTRNVVIAGQRQPGDEDTTRTYELAAAHCFFIHRRTEFAKKLYDEEREVPMFDTAEELAEKILYYLPRKEDRLRFATAAHQRAVPAYSLDKRAAEIARIIRNYMN